MLYTFAYRHLGREHHRASFDSDLPSAQRFAEELLRLPKEKPTDEIRVWEGLDTERTPDAVVLRDEVTF